MMKKWMTFISPVFALLVGYSMSLLGHDFQLCAMGGIATLMAFLWVSEVIHLSYTALLPLVLFPIFGILPAKEVASTYMNSIIMLFVGGFIMAFAMEKWNLHKRIAFWIIVKMGKTPQGLLFSFMLSSYLLSMLILNTTTVIMLLPATLAIISEINISNKKSFGEAILLGLAYAANIGGMTTLIGTAPNLFFAEFFQEKFPEQAAFDFLNWLIKMAPLTIVLFLSVFLFLRNNYFFKNKEGLQIESLKEKQRVLGKISTQEVQVALVFLVAIILWISRPYILQYAELPRNYIHDGSIAIAMALLLYLIPGKEKGQGLVTWQEFEKIPLGVLLLFGGGFSLAAGIQTSGLGALIAEQLNFMGALPSWLVVLFLAIGMSFFTEITSNTASTQLILPILAPLVIAFNWDASATLLAVTLSASCAFMLPVATPPNTIVFGSGKISASNMARVGIILNLLCAVIIAVYLNLIY